MTKPCIWRPYWILRNISKPPRVSSDISSPFHSICLGDVISAITPWGVFFSRRQKNCISRLYYKFEIYLRQLLLLFLENRYINKGVIKVFTPIGMTTMQAHNISLKKYYNFTRATNLIEIIFS